jgi:hypothetical protein
MLPEANCYQRGCRHFLGVRSGPEDAIEMGQRYVCSAYPDGIPSEIAYGEDKHLTPRPGQVDGIVFEKGPSRYS